MWQQSAALTGQASRDCRASVDLFLQLIPPRVTCVRELNYALESHRRIIAVHLEATELSPGQKMSLMDRQAILRYQLTPDQYREKLASGILNQPSPESPSPTAKHKHRQPVRRTFIYFGFPVLLIALVWGLIQLNIDPPTSEDPLFTITNDDPALAVMPFQAISGDQTVADGFHMDVLDRLTRLPGVLVISIDSLNAMQKREASITEIARTLNVSHVVQGSLQQIGEKLRINLKMVDGRTGTVVWSKRYDRSNSDPFTVQTEIANLVARSLKIKLNPSQEAIVAEIPTTNAKAWGLYKQAQDDFPIRLSLLKQAIVLDPGFADAISLLADTRAQMNDFSDETIALARQAVDLKPNRSDYLATLAKTLVFRFPHQSRRRFEEALAMDPLASSFGYAASMFWVNGFLDLSLEIFDQQRRLDPLNPSATHVRALIANREFERATQIATLRQDINGDRWPTIDHAEILGAQNRIAEAIEMIHAMPDINWAVVREKAWLMNAVGLTAEARRYLAGVANERDAANAALPILRDIGRLEDAESELLDGMRYFLPAQQGLFEYAHGDRESALERMRGLLEQFNGLLDDIETRFGNDHLPGYLFRVDAPLGVLLIARLAGNEVMVVRVARKVRFTLANGGTLEIPKREHSVLMMIAALEHDHDEAIRQLDLARQHGLRNMTMLNFYGLLDDPYDLYGGLTDNVRYQSVLTAIEASNQATIATLRVRLPDLFID